MSVPVHSRTPDTGSRPSPSPGRIRAARLIAIAADALQNAILPAFAPGVLSIVNNVLDIVVAILMVGLVGWHFAFLPSFVAELVPGLDLVPTWTLAVWFATRGRKAGPGDPDAPGGGDPAGRPPA
jgi:hypothetical protein